MEIVLMHAPWFACFGLLLLTITSIAGADLSPRVSSRMIKMGILLSVLGLGIGLLGLETGPGMSAAIVGGSSFGLAMLSLVFYSGATIPRNQVDEEPEKKEEETEEPVESEPVVHCYPTFISGPHQKEAKLSFSAWNKSFKSTHEVLIRGDNFMFLQAQASGKKYYGLRWSYFKCEIAWQGYIQFASKSPTYVALECIDGCKIVPSKNGSFRGQDSLLVIEFDVSWDILDSMDTVYVYVKATTNLEGVISVSAQSPTGAGASINETSTMRSEEMGTWVGKCAPV